MSNNQVILSLKQRQQFLTKVIQDAEKGILHAPPGSVEIKKHGKSVQFFHRIEPNVKHGIYIPAAQRKHASALVQKRYLTRLLSAAKKQKKTIDAFLRSYDPNALEEVFQTEGFVRQSLIKPVEVPDLEYASRWQHIEYQGKPFGEDSPVHFTLKQERVRSKSEVLIANALARADVPYKYECPLKLKNQILVYPDFTILRLRDRKQIYWEHLGLIDDTEYRTRAIKKVLSYEENGIFLGENLIISVESYHVPLNELAIQRLIKHYILEEAA